MHRAVWLAGLLLLGGCATGRMTEAECHVADWRAVGFEDGSQGLGADHIGVHRRSCAEHGCMDCSCKKPNSHSTDLG